MLGIRTNHYYHDENDVYEQNSCETSSTYAQSTDGGGDVQSTVEYSNVIAYLKDEDNNHQDDGIFTANSSLN